jgi:hypothetical protein
MPDTPDISKTAQAALYFAGRYKALPGGKGIPRKRLVKMLYLSDLYAREYLGHPITELRYYKDEWGPYDRAIKDYVSELVDAGLAEERLERDEELEYKRLDPKKSLRPDFSAAESEILAYVAKHFLPMPMGELLRDVVYNTIPMEPDPPDGVKLDLDVVNDRGRDEIGFDVEELLQAEEEIKAGRGAGDF